MYGSVRVMLLCGLVAVSFFWLLVCAVYVFLFVLSFVFCLSVCCLLLAAPRLSVLFTFRFVAFVLLVLCDWSWPCLFLVLMCIVVCLYCHVVCSCYVHVSFLLHPLCIDYGMVLVMLFICSALLDDRVMGVVVSCSVNRMFRVLFS